MVKPRISLARIVVELTVSSLFRGTRVASKCIERLLVLMFTGSFFLPLEGITVMMRPFPKQIYVDQTSCPG